MVRRLFQLLTTVAVNAVPAVGWFLEGWSSGTMLAVYWFENVVASLFIAARIAIHRRLVPCRGHFKHNARKGAERGAPGSFLRHFLTISLVFSAGHGFFLTVLLGVLTANGRGAEVMPDWHSVLAGCGSMLLFVTVGFLLDLPGMRRRSFFWIEQLAEGNLARIIIIHITIIFGLLVVGLTGVTKAFFGVFVALKTLNDLNAVVPQWHPDEPPRWLCRIMDRIPSAPSREGSGPRRGETFADFWKRDKADEIARRANNEKRYDAD